MNKKMFLLGATCVLTLFSCGSNNNLIISKIDLSNAKSLFLAKKKNSNDSQQTLFKMTKDGYVEEVTYTWVDKNSGQEKTQTVTHSPQWIKNINNKYLFLCFTNNNLYNYNYLVNKEDFRAYRFPSSFVPDEYSCNQLRNVNVMPIQEVFPTDAAGNIYCNSRIFIDGKPPMNLIKRINIQDPDNITATNASSIVDSTDNSSGGTFAVDKEGNVAYAGIDSGGDNVLRFITKNGAVKNIISSYSYSRDFWTGFDGHIYFNDGNIKKISLSGDKLIFAQYGTKSVKSDVHYSSRGAQMNSRLYMPKLNKILYIDNSSEINELYNTANEPKHTNLTNLNVPLKSIKTFATSENYIYLSAIKTNGDSVVGKLDVSGNTYNFTPYSTGIYDISSLSVNSNEEMSFSGLRMSDGAIVSGIINNKGEINLTNIQFDTQIDYFEEIEIIKSNFVC